MINFELNVLLPRKKHEPCDIRMYKEFKKVWMMLGALFFASGIFLINFLPFIGQQSTVLQDQKVSWRLIANWSRHEVYISLRSMSKDIVNTHKSSLTCFGFGILYPCWSKFAISLPSIRGYGEPPSKNQKKEREREIEHWTLCTTRCTRLVIGDNCFTREIM